MTSRVLGDRDDSGQQKPSLASGVLSSSKKRTLLRDATPLDYTPPGKENVAFRLAANVAVDRGCANIAVKTPECRVTAPPPTDLEESRVEGGTSVMDNTVSAMDNAFLAETSTVTFGSDSDDSRQGARTDDRLGGDNASKHGAKGNDVDSDEDEEDEDVSLHGGSRVIYQDNSTMSPQNINVRMDTPTSGLPAVRKFCSNNVEPASSTPTRNQSTMLQTRTPTNRHDITLESIAPTDIDESFAAGGVGDMPPIGAPSFRRYGALLSPTSNDASVDDLHSDIQPYSGTPPSGKRRSYSRSEDLSDDEVADHGTPVYTLPSRLSLLSDDISGDIDRVTPTQLSRHSSIASAAKRPCTSLSAKTAPQPASPIAPSAAHSRMVEKIQHLRQIVERDSNLEKQARCALQLCLNGETQGTPQELEAERLLLLAGLRSSRCSSEIDRLRQQLATPIIDKDSTANETCACQAELVLSDMNLPLHLNFISTLGRESVAHFVVVARCGPDVFATTHVQSSSDIAGLSAELKFKDQLTLSPVPISGQVDIEVYYMLLSRKNSDSDQIANAPKKRRLLGQHGALAKLTPKKQRNSSLSSSTSGSQLLMTRFTLGASCQLPIDSLVSFASCKMQEWTSHQFLHSEAELRISGQPLYSQHTHSGFLTWREEISGQPNWRRFWCQLDGMVLSAWQYPADQEAELAPIQKLNLEEACSSDSHLSAGSPSALVCIRKNSIVIDVESTKAADTQQFLFFADSKANQSQWIIAFKQACGNFEAWRRLPR